LNNNNRGNNRRRGRGNNRPQGGGGGGGQQVNRIDSRARGNAPQLLEKYRKLAHDAHLNGDRVTEEYYLQFADHYFRVIADTRLRQEEQRARRDDRWQDQPEEAEDTSEYAGGEYQGYDQGYTRSERAPREDRGDRPERAERSRDDASREDRPRAERQRDDRREREPRGEDAADNEAVADSAEGEGGEDQPRSIYEPPANPFVRENRGNRGLRPRREDRRPRPRDDEGETGSGNLAEPDHSGLDAILPPSLGVPREIVADEPADEAPAPKRRGRKPKAAAVSEEG